PCTGLRRGDVRARVPDRRARREARAGSAGAAPQEPRERQRREAVLVEEPDAVLRAHAEALGSARPGAGELGQYVEARRRHGGPAVRAAAADLKRQIIEIAAQRHDREERVLDIVDGMIVSADGNLSEPLEELVGLLGDAQILGKGARGPNPTGMSVLTFGVQVAEVAVDVETGEVRVERVAAAHDVGRIINPLGARSQVEGGIIQGIGHTLSEQRLLDPGTGRILTTTLDAYRMPTIADVPEVVCEFVDKPD